MSLYKCDKCGCIENTALSGYWFRDLDKSEKLCSECDPNIGKWHGCFEKRNATEEGMLLGSDGYLYDPMEDLTWRIENQGFKIIGPA